MPAKAGKLIVISTPIGNLEDISIRAINSLKASDLIACENTKHSSILLNKYEITSKRISLHKFNEASRIESLIKALDEGKSVAYISDAGTLSTRVIAIGPSDEKTPVAFLIFSLISFGNFSYALNPDENMVLPWPAGISIPWSVVYLGRSLPE